jgi:putative colanic acid biosysnthesis UDP-glucose lipid carrier transferase
VTETALYPPAPLPLGVRTFKRTTDVLFGLASIIFPLAPLLVINWLYYLPRGGGSPLVSEPRVGKDGVFAFYKLRIETRDGLRTPFGELLRHWGIDEVPQGINILIGDMSVVGPRPPSKTEHDAYVLLDPTYVWRYIVRPGLFGLAIGTVTHRLVKQTQLADAWLHRHALDLEYIREWTLPLELRSCKRSLVDMILGHDPN